ncbi:MAG: hypothetical protein F6K39_39990 [Okeania sp. SIO3B3]|nr:hypothetical protein [Okeania sp. SIO3B3]
MKFLRNWRRKLLGLFNFQSPGGGLSYGVALEKEIPKEYLRFLMEVLQAEVDSNSDPEVVYPLLAKNQDKLDLTFAEIIKEWFESEVESDNSERNQFLAATLNNFAIDISNFPLGSRANNLEIAIASYQAALEIRTRQ